MLFYDQYDRVVWKLNRGITGILLLFYDIYNIYIFVIVFDFYNIIIKDLYEDIEINIIFIFYHLLLNIYLILYEI